MHQEYELDRRLGSLEKFLWLIDKQSRINLMMHAGVRGTLSENTLRVALKSIQARHPILRVRVVREGRSNARFVSGGVPEIPFRVLEAPQQEWEKLAEEELNTDFVTETGPLVRATLVRHTGNLSTLLLTIHHCIGDGISGAYLMRDLLQAASMSESGKNPSLSMLPARKELGAYLPSWARGLSGRWRYWQYWWCALAPIVRYGKPANLKIEQKAPLRRGRAHFISRMLGPEMVRKVSEKAGREKTTVHGALGSAIILALAKDEDRNGECLYLVGSPVNLRSRLDPPIEDDVGLYITMGTSSGLAGQSTEFWSLAREFRESLLQCVERGYPFVYLYQQKDLNLVASINGIGPWGQRTYAHFARMMNPGAWGLSNIGRIRIEANQGPFTIESLGTSASGSVWYRFASFAVTIEDRMTWNFVSMEPMHTREYTERITDLALKTLKEAIEDM
jgi:hypothetical protein